MNTISFILLTVPVFSRKIILFKEGFKPDIDEELFSFGEMHGVITDNEDLYSNMKDNILEIIEDEQVKIIEPIERVQDIYEQFICGKDYSWGLDRINQRDLPLDCEYVNEKLGSDDVTVYVLDTGIETSHPWLKNSVWGANMAFGNNNNNDADGHGTHVAGIIGGLNVGVSQKVTIVAVKVLDDNGSGYTSDIINGMNWVLKDVKKRKTKGIINMSLGGPGTSSAFDWAIEYLFLNGVITVVAAGNENADACNSSPASSPRAITVGASGSNDEQASFSNYGECVNIYAPGLSILSSYIGGGSAHLSGTSMASPFVAGVVASIWANNPSLTPQEIVDLLYDEASMNKLSKLQDGTINRFVYLSGKTLIPWRFIIFIIVISIVLVIILCLLISFCRKHCCKKRTNVLHQDIALPDILEPGALAELNYDGL